VEPQAFINFIVHSLAHKMTTGKGIDKVAKLLDLLDKHIREKKCNHSSKDLLSEYEKLLTH
jgi:hypothetical protein